MFIIHVKLLEMLNRAYKLPGMLWWGGGCRVVDGDEMAVRATVHGVNGSINRWWSSVVLVDRGGVMEAAGWSWWCGDRRLPAVVPAEMRGWVVVAAKEWGRRVVESDIVDRVDRETESIFGFAEKARRKKFSGGGGGGCRQRPAGNDGRDREYELFLFQKLCEGLVLNIVLKFGLLKSPTIEPSPPLQEPIPTPPQAQPASPSSPQEEQPTSTSESPMTLLNTFTETCATLSKKVAHLEQDKIAQALEIIKLKKRVKKLEKTRRSKFSGGCIQIGGRIKAIDANEEITLVEMKTQANLGAELQERKDDDNDAIKDARLLDDQMAKRLHDEEIEQATAREKQKKDDLEKAKVLQKQYVDKQENIDWNVVVEEMQEKHLDNIRKYQSLKRKPISIAQAKKNIIVYWKNIAWYKMEHFKGMTYDKTLLQESFKKLKAFKVLGSYSIEETPTDDPKEMSKEEVKNMLEIVLVSEFKVEALQVKHDMYMMTEKDYPLSNGVMTLMLSTRLQVEEDSEMARDLVMKIFIKANQPKRRSLDTSSKVLVTKPHNKIPYELLLGRTPSIGFTRPFGCHVTILNTLDPLGKFDGKADEGFLVGYSINRKAFRVFNIVVGNQPNHNAGIKENIDAGKVGKETESDQQYVLLPLWSTGLQDPQNIDADASFDVKENENEVHVSLSIRDKPMKHDEKAKRKAKGKSHVILSTGVKDLNHEFEEFSVNSTNRVNTTSAPVTAVRPNPTNSTNSFNVADMPALEDIVYSDYEDDVGVEADFTNLETTISVSPIPTTREEGIDYDEVFAPVARIEAIRLFLAYDSFMGFMDLKTLIILIRFIEWSKHSMGLHSAPRAWYETLANYLLENGFQRRKINQTLFIKKQKGDILLVQVYVDDIIFGSTNKELCQAFEKLMKDKFKMSSMGELIFFLGLQVKKKDDGIFISQDKYVAKILRMFGFTDVKLANTPIKTKKPLLKDPDGEDVDVHIYMSMISSLMYLTSSRPDIMFGVYACA
nr:hypothetical protein [Tanacetum cinerariifolium]